MRRASDAKRIPMSDIQVFTAIDLTGAAEPATTAVLQRGAPAIAVEIADTVRLARLRPEWTDLLSRADVPNVLMDPAMVAAAAEVFPEARSQALLAWKARADGTRQLAGVWAFSVGRPHQSAVPVRVLTIPPGPHRYLATPVIDRACLDQTLDAMLDALAADPDLPKIATLDAMSADSPTMEALERVLAARGSAPCVLEQFRRPKLSSGLDGKSYLEKALSSSSRKKLRQHRRRLAEKGELTTALATEPQAVRAALEDFMAMEAAGWKGRQGTALLCDAGNAAFMRKAIVGMAELGCASIHALCFDGRPISMQVVVRAGAAAFTWKTAYDERFQDFSPGMLLLEDYTTAFLADKSIAYVDSCAHDDSGYMSAWTERQAVADLWIDARRGGSFAFWLLAGLQKRYRDLRAFTKKTYLALQEWRTRWRKS
jgi:CelD/BcsL family acetyltransferase involved in cellulose biosynthesis